MMEFKKYRDVREFYEDIYDVLMRHEAMNAIILGNLLIGYEGKYKDGWRDSSKWLMYTVSDKSGVRLSALMTPPMGITLYATDNQIDDAALACLIEGLTGQDIPGVMTEKALAKRFAALYGREYLIKTELRQFELLQVSQDIPEPGQLRRATEDDLFFLPYWLECFYSEVGREPFIMPTDIEKYRATIDRNLHVYENEAGTPVSIASVNRELQNSCNIASVYTPQYFRGRGYATACVAKLSRQQLKTGYKRCTLYTDLSNPTSNNIYQKIGYKPIADSLELKFI